MDFSVLERNGFLNSNMMTLYIGNMESDRCKTMVMNELFSSNIGITAATIVESALVSGMIFKNEKI
jgi:hypothetical protein